MLGTHPLTQLGRQGLLGGPLTGDQSQPDSSLRIIYLKRIATEADDAPLR